MVISIISPGRCIRRPHWGEVQRASHTAALRQYAQGLSALRCEMALERVCARFSQSRRALLDEVRRDLRHARGRRVRPRREWERHADA